MADITDILQSLTQNVSGLEGMNKALSEFNVLKKEALASGDAKAILQIENLTKAVLKLRAATKEQTELEAEYIEVQKEAIKNKEDDGKATEKITQKLKKNSAELARTEQVLTKATEGTTEAHKKSTAAMIANHEAMMDVWKSSTKLGKTYSALTSVLAKVTGGITAAVLAGKAWDSFVEGANLRQEMLIQQFQGFKDATTGTAESFSEAGLRAEAMANALRKVEADAIRMGVSVDGARGVMLDFSRIAGTTSPEDLQKLSSATITVARTMGMDLSEAVDFVRIRMDKFGGTGAGAVVALQNIREETESVNKMFGRTVVRADDVTRTLLDISRSTAMYAIDQRMVSGILRENIARLQSTGDSYDLASRKAAAFAGALTGDAPEFMKILAGQDISGQFQKVFKEGLKKGKGKGKEAFLEKFGADLDAAAPGLANKVGDILEKMDKGAIGQHSGMRLIQELTSGTEAGMAAMNEQILTMGQGDQGIVVLAKLFGKTHEEAAGMLEQAQQYKKRQKEINELVADPKKLQALLKELNVAEATSNLLMSNKIPEEAKKKRLKEILSIRDQEIDQMNEAKRIFDERGKKQELVTKTKVELEEYGADLKNIEAAIVAAKDQVTRFEKEKKAATASGDKKAEELATAQLATAQKNLDEVEIQKIRQDNLINSAEETISQNTSKAADDKGAQKTMEELTAENLKDFGSYADVTGQSFKAQIKELSTIRNLLIGMVAFFVGGKLIKGLAGVLARGSKAKDIGKASKGLIGKGGPGGGGKGGRAAKFDDKARVAREHAAAQKGEYGGEKRAKAYEAEAKKFEDKAKKARGKEAKFAEIEEATKAAKEGRDYKPKPKSQASTLPDKMKGAGSIAGDTAKAETKGLSKMSKGFKGGSKLGFKMAKKGLKAIPGIGTLFGGGDVLSKGWDLYKKWKSGVKVSSSDKMKMVAGVGSMIPILGTAVVAMDMAAEAAGLYDELDKKFPSAPSDGGPLGEAGELKVAKAKKSGKGRGGRGRGPIADIAKKMEDKEAALPETSASTPLMDKAEASQVGENILQNIVPSEEKISKSLAANVETMGKDVTKTLGSSLKEGLKSKHLEIAELTAGTVNITQGLPMSDIPATGVTATLPGGKTTAPSADTMAAMESMVSNDTMGQEEESDLVGNLGPIDQSGSVTLVISNFIKTVAAAQSQMKKGIRGPGGR